MFLLRTLQKAGTGALLRSRAEYEEALATFRDSADRVQTLYRELAPGTQVS